MGLSMHDRQVLAGIERLLVEGDPGLARRLSRFGDRRMRARIWCERLWRGVAVVSAGVAFLLGTALLSVAAATRSTVSVVTGSLVLVVAALLCLAVVGSRLRRRHRS